MSTAHVDFLSAIDNCKINNNDNPDMVILSDEGIILRRLFSAFSLRPIHILSAPIVVNLLQNPYGYLPDQRVINSLPYITYRLPAIKDQQKTLKLLESHIQFTFSLDVNTGRYAPNSSKIFSVNGPLVYHIPRKYIDIPVPLSPINNIAQLPTVVNNRLTFHKYKVEFHDTCEFNNSQYRIVSVVSISQINNSNNINLNIINGNYTTLFLYDEMNNNMESQVYMPQNVLDNDKKYFVAYAGPQILELKTNLALDGSIFIYDKYM